MKWFFGTLILIFVVLAISLIFNIMPGSNDAANIMSHDGRISGFWMGLIHGIIAPVSFIISLFNHNVNLYEIHNNGGWYNLGFVLGDGILFRKTKTRTVYKKKK